jgi:hypothetical protein
MWLSKVRVIMILDSLRLTLGHFVWHSGTVFDVSAKRDVYGPSGSYRIFAGKDGSKGLGLSSLKPEDAVSDWSSLDASGRKVLDDWHAFFSKVGFEPQRSYSSQY